MLNPINDQVFIQEEKEQTSKYGLILPDAKIACIGIIYAIGENEWELKKGDRVIFSRYAVENVVYCDSDGKNVPNLNSLHVDAIHAKITD